MSQIKSATTNQNTQKVRSGFFNLPQVARVFRRWFPGSLPGFFFALIRDSIPHVHRLEAERTIRADFSHGPQTGRGFSFQVAYPMGPEPPLEPNWCFARADDEIECAKCCQIECMCRFCDACNRLLNSNDQDICQLCIHEETMAAILKKERFE